MTQRQFAEEVGFAKSMVSDYECGNRTMGRLSTLAVIDAFRDDMKAARITAEDLLRGDFSRGA